MVKCQLVSVSGRVDRMPMIIEVPIKDSFLQ